VTDDAWEQQLAAVWATVDTRGEEEFRAAVDALVAELPDDDPVGLYERGGALDSTGHSDQAIPFYRRALAGGLDEERRRRTVISLASSLRNVGRPEESVDLLTAELGRRSDQLDDAVRAFLALALVDTGRERDAVALLLTTLAPHLPRYQRSVANYARLLTEREPWQP
jgi:tetratricopeptide (TPR) repeat protein